MAADRINFVNEDDARRVLLALFEQIAHPARTYADEHLNEIGTRNRKERYVRFARNRPRQQSLAGSRRAHEQHALRNASTKLLEFLRVLQEINNFVQLFFRLINSRHVLERRLLLLRRQQTSAGFAEAERLVSTRLHLLHHENPEQNQQQQRAKIHQKRQPVGVLHFLVVIENVVVLQRLGDVWYRGVGHRHAAEFSAFAVLALQFGAVRRKVNRHVLNAVVLHLRQEIRVIGFVVVRGLPPGRGHPPQDHRQQNHQEPK